MQATPIAGTQTRAAPAAPFQSSLEQLLAGLAYIDLRVRWAVMRARANGLNPDDEFRGLYVSEAQIDALLGLEMGGSLWPHGNGQEVNGQAGALANWPAALAQARGHWQGRTEASRAAG